MVTKQLFIVRHGETDFNRQNIVQGSGVDKELNALGRLQAQNFTNITIKSLFNTSSPHL